MIYFGFFLAISIMGGMIYMALGKKTEPSARLACLAALGVMVLTVLICLFLALTDNSVPLDESNLIVGAPVETKKDSGANMMTLIFLFLMIIAIYGLITFLVLRENKRNKRKKKEKKESVKKFEF